MRVRLLATGTRGDVQSYVALGLGLKRAGFEVSLAATADSRPFVESYGVSPSVLPKARDWGGHVHLTGYWFLPDDYYEPPEDQNHFLNAGDPPVFVGFGSMASKDPRATAVTELEAVKEAGVRAVLASGWSGLSASEAPPAPSSVHSRIPSMSQWSLLFRPIHDDPQDLEADQPGRKRMRKTAVYGTVIVFLTTMANLLHAVSHIGQEVLSLEVWQWAYVIGVIYLAPIAAAVMLWTPYRLAGAWLLLASMVGSFAFDFAYHFLIPGPDNVFSLEPGTWLLPFWGSAVLLVAVSGVGTLVGGWTVRRLSRSQGRAPSELKGCGRMPMILGAQQIQPQETWEGAGRWEKYTTA
jgi:hypothetical protein